MTDWRDLFCGRGAELRELCDAYDAVAAGDGPRFIVVLGERGMGKTRLVQEFYRTLSRERDPENYWPDASLFRGRNLLFAPDVEGDPEVQAHFAAFALGARPMPFLWWGLRLSDPDDRNALATDLTTHRRFLDLHLEPVRHARRLIAHREAVVEMGRDAATSGVMKAIEAIPVLGSAIGLALEGGLFARRAVKLKAERNALMEQQQNEQVTRMAQVRSDDLVATTLADLEEWMELPGNAGRSVGAAGPGRPRIPLILFVDDAQFARPGGDEGVFRLVSELWPLAVGRGWPLLLVATHWETDWRSRTDGLAGVFRPLLQQTFPGWQPLVLGRESGMADLVQAGLEGLPPADVFLVLDKADGNPQLLLELIERIRRSPAWRTRDGALSAVGRTQLQTARLALHDLIVERMENESIGDEVRRAVAVSSMQGVEFSCSLAEEAAALLDAGPVRKGLEAAEETHRFVSGVQSGVAGFLQRAYRDAALSLVDGHFGSREVVLDALRGAIDRFVDDPERWHALNPIEQDAALALRASLGEHAADPARRLGAARAMVALTRRTMDTEGAADFARAARWARAFGAGLADGRWGAEHFTGAELARMHAVLAYWDGPAAGVGLARAVVTQRRREFEGQGEVGTSGSPADVGSPGALDPAPNPSDLIVALWELSSGLEMATAFDEAAEVRAEASERVRALVETDPSPANRWMLAAALEREAAVARTDGDAGQEESIRREALALMLGIETADPVNPILRVERVRAMLHLATCLELGEPSDEALGLLQQALVLQTALLQEGLENRFVRDAVAILLALANAEARRGASGRAAFLFTQAVVSARGAFEVEATQDHRRILAVVCRQAAEAAWDRGEPGAAFSFLFEGIGRLEEVVPPPDPTHAFLHAQHVRTAARFVQERGDEVGAGLRSLLDRMAQGMATHPALVCWSYAEVAGRLAAHLDLADTPGEVEALRNEVMPALEATGSGTARANWYQGALLGCEAALRIVGSRNDTAGRVAVLHRALHWAAEYDEDLGDDEARGDLLWWIVMAGQSLLEVGALLEPATHEACTLGALAPPAPEEEKSTGRMRSSALSLLATLGTHLSMEVRAGLLELAGVWFAAVDPPDPLARLAGYEAEVTLGAIEQTDDERCGILSSFADDLREILDDAAVRKQSLEWRFLERLANSWGCAIE